MNREATLPIEWESWDQYDFMKIGFINVRFLEDFGPFIKNERAMCLSIDYSGGTVGSLGDNGEVLKSVNVVLKPEFSRRFS